MTRVRVGEVEVKVDRELTPKEVRALLRTCAGIALGLAEASPEPERSPIGFTCITERLPETELPDEPGDD